MEGTYFVIAIGEDEQTGHTGDPPGKEFYEIQRSLVGPMDVFEYDKRRPVVVQLMQEPGEQSDPVFGAAIGLPVLAPDLPYDIMEGPQRAGREQGVTDA